MVSEYNGAMPTPRHFMRIVSKRLQIRGFGVADYAGRGGEFYHKMTPLITSGAIRSIETVVEGLEAAPAAFMGLFSGKNLGKMLVKLA